MPPPSLLISSANPTDELTNAGAALTRRLPSQVPGGQVADDDGVRLLRPASAWSSIVSALRRPFCSRAAAARLKRQRNGTCSKTGDAEFICLPSSAQSR